MSQWSRGEKLSEIKSDKKNSSNRNNQGNNQCNTNNNKQFTRSVSFEQQPHRNQGYNQGYNQGNNQGYNNRYNSNQNNNNHNRNNQNIHLTRGVSFDTHSRNRQWHQDTQNNNNTIEPVLEPAVEPVLEPENTTSTWKEIIEAKKKEELEIINVNNPKYWNGPYWIGQSFVKSINKNGKSPDYNNRFSGKNNQSTPNSFVIPHSELRYSRNNKDWYSTREETYRPNELEKVADYERQHEFNCYIRLCEQDYQRSKIASDKHYAETGELDAFAMENNRQIEYERYCEEFETNSNYDQNDYDYEYE